MNVDAIRKVRDQIAGLPPEQFDMRFLAARAGVAAEPATYGDILHSCDTAACIAGWSIAVLAPESDGYWADAQTAADLLDLGEADAEQLFTPDGFRQTGRYTQPMAVAVINKMIAHYEATDGEVVVDWSVAEQVPA